MGSSHRFGHVLRCSTDSVFLLKLTNLVRSREKSDQRSFKFLTPTGSVGAHVLPLKNGTRKDVRLEPDPEDTVDESCHKRLEGVRTEEICPSLFRHVQRGKGLDVP